MTSLFSSTRLWPRLSTSATPASLVSFSRIVLFVDQSAHESFREKKQVTLWYFSTARTSWSSTVTQPASLVSFSRIVLSRTSPLTNRSAKILQVTLPSWLIASRCRCLTPIGAGASLVSFSRIGLSQTSPLTNLSAKNTT